MPDIFGYNRTPKPENVFSNSGSLLTFGVDGDTVADGIGELVQNWNITYNNNITEVFELGSNKIYWVQGRPTGAGNIGRIVGLGNIKLFPESAFDVCQGGATMNISAKPGSCEAKQFAAVKKANLKMGGCIVTSIGFNASVADTRINETIAWRFSTLEVTEK